MTDMLEVKVKKKRKKTVSLDKKKARAGWIFVLPFIIGLVFVYFPIVFESLEQSLFYKVPGDATARVFNKFAS